MRHSVISFAGGKLQGTVRRFRLADRRSWRSSIRGWDEGIS